MNPPVLILTALLLPAVLGIRLAFASERDAPYWYPTPATEVPRPGQGAGFIDSYGERYLPLESMTPARPNGQRESLLFGGDAIPGQRPPWADVPGAGVGAPGLFETFVGYPPVPLEGLDGRGSGQGNAVRGGSGGPRQPGLGGPWGRPPVEADRELSSPLRPEYRFRGDDRFGGPAEGTPHGGGWRFRPLTEQELAQPSADQQWRPARPANRSQPGGQPQDAGVAHEPEAFGYEPDNWFRRYYGERP